MLAVINISMNQVTLVDPKTSTNNQYEIIFDTLKQYVKSELHKTGYSNVVEKNLLPDCHMTDTAPFIVMAIQHFLSVDDRPLKLHCQNVVDFRMKMFDGIVNDKLEKIEPNPLST
jgi:hypothetical protein